MCGIIGIFGQEQASSKVLAGLKIMHRRGIDGCGITNGVAINTESSLQQLQLLEGENTMGHLLHAMVGCVAEPIQEGSSFLVANCEIYNWEQLAKNHHLNPKNDAHLLLLLLNKVGVEETLKEIRGVYAFGYWAEGKVTIARDILGIKPLWYSLGDGFFFASERKALSQHCKGILELNPRTVITYDTKTRNCVDWQREFFSLHPEIADESQAIALLSSKLEESIRIRIPEKEKEVGVLFSGGIDSSLIAHLLKKQGVTVRCYTAGVEGSIDASQAQESAALLNVPLTIVHLTKDEIESMIPQVIELIEDTNVVKVGVAIPFYAACKRAHEDGIRVIFSGAGSDELFAGYHRYKMSPATINKDSYSELLKYYEKNAYRDDVVTMNNTLELRVPFLDKEVVSLGLRIAPQLKLKQGSDASIEKYIVRRVAQSLGLPAPICEKRKKAAQYGSGVDKILDKLAQGKRQTKSAYLDSFRKKPIMRLGALISSGKDSLYAAYIMKNQNYDISCAITLQSKNPDSFMFHTPNTHLVTLQAEAMGIPLIIQETKGEKEEELHDLRIALRKAKDEHRIEGITSGALYSNYQRERIERVADELGLKLFSPLWHMDQKEELMNLLKAGFDIIFVKVAAEGLDSSWLGRTITLDDIPKLVALHKKYGINIAGEGGEYESLVLDCPLFEKKLHINSSSIDNSTQTLRIDSAVLQP